MLKALTKGSIWHAQIHNTARKWTTTKNAGNSLFFAFVTIDKNHLQNQPDDNTLCPCSNIRIFYPSNARVAVIH